MSTMAEGTYEYECMRAELLGVEKPDHEEFLKKKQDREATAAEEQETENLKDVDYEEETMKNISGGLDELNSILQVTQRKINKFKASCGSLTNLLKIKFGGASSSESDSREVKIEVSENHQSEDGSVKNGDNCSEGPRKSDLSRALDNHVDRLDAMIEKAENAQYSMAHQNKEMKRFLN